jgi:CO dehydrogenase maturation factor
MQKVARDFIVKDDFVTLIDMEAGIEHFGRGIEKNVDIILVIVDPTFESFIIAEIVKRMSALMGNKNVYAILNKVNSKETDLTMQNSLKKRRVDYLGSINFDKDVHRAGLEGKKISKCKAEKQIAQTVKRLENILGLKNHK